MYLLGNGGAALVATNGMTEIYETCSLPTFDLMFSCGGSGSERPCQKKDIRFRMQTVSIQEHAGECTRFMFLQCVANCVAMRLTAVTCVDSHTDSHASVYFYFILFFVFGARFGNTVWDRQLVIRRTRKLSFASGDVCEWSRFGGIQRNLSFRSACVSLCTCG